MTFPIVSTRGTPGNSGNATTHTPAVPAHAVGEVIVIPLGFDTAPTVTVDEAYSGTGWTLTAPGSAPAAGTPWLVIAWKIAESTSEVLRVNTNVSEASCYIPWSIDAGDNPELYFAFADGTSATPNPPNLAPAPGNQDYLVLAIFARDNQGTATSGPSGYTNFRTEAGVSSGGVSMAVAEKEITASSEDPGTFAVGNENWLACTIFVYNNTSGGVDTTPPTMNGAIEITAYTEGGTGYSIAWPAATDNVAVDGYELSLNNGSSWSDLGDVLTYNRTGGTVGATDQIRVRAYDAAANVAATPLELDLLVGGRYIDALSFKSNGTTDSDVKFHWADSTGDMPPQKTTLCIKWSKRRQQTGFYAEWWRMPNLDATYGNVVGDTYAGFHPYPCDGIVDTDGTTTGTTGSGVSTHFAEIAGLPNRDIIGNAALESHASVKGEWVADASYTEVNGSNVRHRYYPDLFGDPDFFITVDIPTSTYDAETNDTAPHLMFGAPTWTVSGSTNPETPAGEHRGYRVFDTSTSGTFSVAEMQAEAQAAWDSTNAPATAKGINGVWYINDDPTPTDITDKSGESHDPTWGNARRPDAYTEIVAAVDEPTPVTATTSLAMAVQLARAASASAAVAVQAPAQATSSVALAVATAQAAGASLAGAVQQALSANALVQAAVQAPVQAGADVAAAVQLARSAAAQLDVAVQQASTLGAAVDLQVQAPSEVGISVSLMVQAGSELSAAVSVAVQSLREASTSLAMAVSQGRTLAASADVAVQVGRTSSYSVSAALLLARQAGASVDLQVQGASTQSLALQAAVQFAADASASVSGAVSRLASANVGLAAAISLQNTLGAAVDAYVLESTLAALGVALFVLDEGGDALESDTSRYRRIARAIERGVVDGATNNTFLKIGKRSKYRSM